MLGGLLGSNDPAPAAIKIFLVINSCPSEVAILQRVILFSFDSSDIESTLSLRLISYSKGLICSISASTCC